MIINLIDDISWGSIIQTKHNNHSALDIKLRKILSDFSNALAIIESTMYQSITVLVTTNVGSMQGIIVNDYNSIRMAINNFILSHHRFIWNKWGKKLQKNVFKRIIEHRHNYGYIGRNGAFSLQNQVVKKFN